MPIPLPELEAELTTLDRDTRCRFAELLLDSLEDESEVAEQLDEEAERRHQLYSTGEMEAFPAEQVIAEAYAKLRGGGKAQAIKEAALSLSRDERDEIANALLASLRDPEADRLLALVAERRYEELRTGKVKGIPAEEALRRLRKRIRRTEESD